MRQLEADLLAEFPLSEDVDWASDDSSNPPELEEVQNDSPLPDLEMCTVEAVLGDLSPTPEEEETVRIHWNPLSGVSCPQNVDWAPMLSCQSPASVAQRERESDDRERSPGRGSGNPADVTPETRGKSDSRTIL